MSAAPERGARLARWARSTPRAGVAGFLWGYAEGLFFVVVPDVYVSYAALFSPAAGAAAWGASIAGSLLAVVSIALMMSVLGVDYPAFLAHLPGIHPHLLEAVRTSVSEGGLPHSPLAILKGIPLKVYAAGALSSGQSLGGLLLWTLAARVVRILPAYLLSAAVGAAFRRRIDAAPGAWCAVLCVLWAAFYLFYFTAMASR